MSIEVTGISYLICALAYLSMAQLLMRSRAQHRYKTLLITGTLTTAVWAAAVALRQMVPDWAPVVDLWVPVFEQARTLAWMATVGFVLFVVYGKRPERGVFIAIGGTTAAAMLYVIGITFFEGAMGDLLPTPLVRAGFIAQVLVAVIGLLLIENLFRNSGRDARWALKYLCFGLGGMFVYDFFVYAEAALFARIDPTLYAARGIIDAMAAPPVIIAAARSRKWPIDLHVSRRLVFHSATLLGAGVYLIVMSIAGYYLKVFDSTWGGLAQTVFISAAVLGLVAVLASGSAQARVRDFVNQNFFNYRYDYRQEWLRFIAVFSDSLTEMSIAERIVRGLANIVESTGGAAWVLREEDEAYHRVATWNMGDTQLPSVAVNDPFVQRLAGTRSLIDVKSRSIAGHDEPDAEPLVLPAWLADHMRAWLVLALIHSAGLPGFVVLALPRAARKLDWEAIELLTTAGQQAASYIAEENAARSLSRARRFEDFNRQFAFVVHDIKNLTGQMTLILKNAERHGNNPEFQRDVMATVRDSVLRMTQLLDQLRANKQASAATATATPTIDVRQLMEKLAADWRLQIPGLRVDAPSGAVPVLATQERLTAVLNHLIQNAADAAGNDGLVSLTLAKRAGQDGDEAAAPQWAEIVVADNGPGMDASFIVDKLFQPLDSTKTAGFGIGAYQCRQQVREMGGRLLVDSALGAGTRMIVRLPLVVDRVTSSRAEAPAPEGIYRHG